MSMSMEAEAFAWLRRLEKRIEAIEARVGMTEPKDTMEICDAKGVLGGSSGPMTPTFTVNDRGIINCMFSDDGDAR